ncbi:MAG: hypothetical protein R2762_30355 [Bryobacteraceae bacterium]
MKPLLLLILLALPVAAQYPAGAVFQRGDDPRWAAPDFDDRQWVKQSDYRPDSNNDYLQNRSWMRARVTIPAGEPAVIVSQHCPCEFYVNGVRVAAIGDLNQPRPHTPRQIRIFPLPAGIPAGEAVFAVRRYDPPGLESVGYTWAKSSALLVPDSGADQALERFAKTVLASARLNVLFVLFALAALLGATWGQRMDAAYWVAILMEGCSLLAVGFTSLELGGIADHSNLNSIGWSLANPVAILPAILLALLVPRVNRRIWLSACLLAGAIRCPFFVAPYYGVPPSWSPLAVAAAEAGIWLIVVTTLALVTLALRLGGIPRPLLLFCVLGPLCSLLMRLGATWGQRKDAAFWVALALEGCALLAVVFLSFVSIGSADQSTMNSIGWSFVIPIAILPAILLVLLVPGVNRRLWLPACLLAGAIRVPSYIAPYYGVPPSWAPHAVVPS